MKANIQKLKWLQNHQNCRLNYVHEIKLQTDRSLRPGFLGLVQTDQTKLRREEVRGGRASCIPGFLWWNDFDLWDDPVCSRSL